MITPLPVTPLKPGSATKPFFGIEVAVVNDKGQEVSTGEEGTLVITSPWPGMTAGVFKDDQRFIDTYWSKYKKQGWYLTGDSAKKDEDGYYWIIGRTDDVIKVSGYRLGSAEIESVMISHGSVAESAAIALPHQACPRRSRPLYSCRGYQECRPSRPRRLLQPHNRSS